MRGQEVFVRNCKRCHGPDGAKGFLGAKDLRTSRLAADSILLYVKSLRH
ncbi:MAG: c-type cytochrome [Bacteroidetes bacterium]|nr:c-type cytochrome [Bacteroidota bacterium]